MIFFFFFFNDTATTEIYTLSLHDALPIFRAGRPIFLSDVLPHLENMGVKVVDERPYEITPAGGETRWIRSEEHTSELQSRQYLVCRLLLEKKKKKNISICCTYK